MTRPVIISLFEYTGTMLRPWADAGYTCFAYDIQHVEPRFEPSSTASTGGIWYMHFDADDLDQWADLCTAHGQSDVRMIFSFPPCTDLAGSGAAHWARKRAANPAFQEQAAARAMHSKSLAGYLGAPYMIENPVGAMSRFLGKAQHSFHPYQYGGYIDPADAEHPLWPEYITARDAYRKKTMLWTGNGFVMPVPDPVKPVELDGQGGSNSHNKLGGKSMKTKNIRSATPRGFARAVFEANHTMARPVSLGRLSTVNAA